MKINIMNCRGSSDRIAQMSPPDFYCGRPSPMGNPFHMSSNTREEAIEKFKPWLKEKLKDKKSKQYLELQKMKQSHKDFGVINLWCWCDPLPCHCNVIKKILVKNGNVR
jgi:hypothetical protein